MSIYDRFVNRLKSPAPLEEKITELKEQVTNQEEKMNDYVQKIIDFSSALEGVNDSGNIVYSYINSLNKAYSTNYVINKSCNLLAYSLSKLPLRVSRNGEPMPEGFILPGGFNILQPHPRMSLSRLLYECAIFYWYKGEFMSAIDEEVRLSLEPIDPSMMKIYKADGRMIEAWRWNNSSIIEADSLIYSSMMNPDITFTTSITDIQRTVSLIKVVEKELSNYVSGREFNLQFFANYAQLGLTLTDVAGTTTKGDREVISDQIDNKLSRGRAWKTRVLPQGFDVAKTKNLSMREMEFSQSLKDIRDIILAIYGVPRSVFGITNESGLAQSTIDNEEKIMWSSVIQPAAHQIQEAFNQTLMKRYFPAYKLFFDYSGIKVLQDNMSDKADLAVKYQALGYTTEEINSMLNLGMEESTDTRMNERFHSSNLLPYSEVEFDVENSSKSIVVDDTINKIAELVEKGETKAVSAQNYRNRYNRIQRKTEKEMVSQLGIYFAKQFRKVMAVVNEDTKTVKDINETLLLSELMNLLNAEKKVLVETMQPLYEKGALGGSTLALNTLKLDKPAVASEFVVGALTNEITMINNNTYKLISAQVKESINAGESTVMLTKRIQGVYKFNKSRARTIARTESLKVVSRSTDEEYRKEGVKMKEWLSSPGARVTHAANTAQGKIAYDNAFSNGLQFPGDSGPAAEVVNCRCALAPVIE